jgi:hypothetical protein
MQKIAIIIDYLDRVHHDHHGTDTLAFRSYMDDPEVQTFLAECRRIGIPNSRFTRAPSSR